MFFDEKTISSFNSNWRNKLYVKDDIQSVLRNLDRESVFRFWFCVM